MRVSGGEPPQNEGLEAAASVFVETSSRASLLYLSFSSRLGSEDRVVSLPRGVCHYLRLSGVAPVGKAAPAEGRALCEEEALPQ